MTARELVRILQGDHELSLAESVHPAAASKCQWCGQWGAKKWGGLEHVPRGPETAYIDPATGNALSYDQAYPHYPGCAGVIRRKALQELYRVVEAYAEEYSDELRGLPS